MNRTQLTRGAAVTFVLIACSATVIHAQGQRPAENITSDQAMECIRTAIASHPGRIESLDVDVKAGKVLCEVEIMGENGRKMELHVDVASSKVVDSRPD